MALGSPLPHHRPTCCPLPAHKNQHFVPKCHLRPFASEPSRRAINVLNIASNRAIQNCSIKAQCSREYFYGRDLKIETLLQGIEEHYARTVARLSKEPASASSDDLALLRNFAYLQYTRTEAAFMRIKSIYEEAASVSLGGRRLSADIANARTNEEHVLQSLRNYANCVHYTYDLKTSLFVNTTSSEFITSDDPAVLTNRYHVQRLRYTRYGIGSAGAMLVLPLSPKLVLFCYDGAVYTVPGKIGEVVYLRKPSDVSAINELQFLNAAYNLYFSGWSERDQILDELRSHNAARPTKSFTFDVFVKGRGLAQFTEFRRAESQTELDGAREALMNFSFNHPSATSWPSVISYRSPIREVNTETAAGRMRIKAWESFRKRRPTISRGSL